MATEPKLIGLFGMFGTGNIGNDGSLEVDGALSAPRGAAGAPAVHLRQPRGGGGGLRPRGGADLSQAATPEPTAGRSALLQRAAGGATLWVHAVRHLRRLKVLIIPGMGVLDDFSVSPLGLGWPHDILSWCLLGRLMGVKIIFASVGAGPIRHPVSRWLMKAAAGPPTSRSYRDTVSKAFMESIGFDTRDDPIYPDIAFRLPAPASTRAPAGAGQPLTIGVGVMAYCGWRNDPDRGAEIYAAYLGKITSFVLWLLDRGHRRARSDGRPGGPARGRRSVSSRALEAARARRGCHRVHAGRRRSTTSCSRSPTPTSWWRPGITTSSARCGWANPRSRSATPRRMTCSWPRWDWPTTARTSSGWTSPRLELQTLRLISERPALEDRIRRRARASKAACASRKYLLASLIFGDASAVPEHQVPGRARSGHLIDRPVRACRPLAGRSIV